MTQAPARPAVRRQVLPVYAAGFVTAFGAHAVAANLSRYALGHHGSLWELRPFAWDLRRRRDGPQPVFGALSAALLLCAAVAAPRDHAPPGPAPHEHRPTHHHSRIRGETRSR